MEDDEGISPEALLSLQQAFSMFDGDRSGTIDSAEFYALMRSLGLTLSEEEERDMLLEVPP